MPYQSTPEPLQTFSVQCAAFLAAKQASHHHLQDPAIDLTCSLTVWNCSHSSNFFMCNG